MPALYRVDRSRSGRHPKALTGAADRLCKMVDCCTARFGGGEPTFAGASCNDQVASKAVAHVAN